MDLGRLCFPPSKVVGEEEAVLPARSHRLSCSCLNSARCPLAAALSESPRRDSKKLLLRKRSGKERWETRSNTHRCLCQTTVPDAPQTFVPLCLRHQRSQQQQCANHPSAHQTCSSHMVDVIQPHKGKTSRCVPHRGGTLAT